MVNKKEIETPAIFTKEQVVSSKRYENKKDAISVILKDGEMYSLEEVDALIDEFMKGTVN